ncbi:MAG TPA: glycogen debranching enzyme GlgX, partial [Roseiarcus sp.]|nr:glycogen debranching enzyme GlgX [Roseiarcus sp.]
MNNPKADRGVSVSARGLEAALVLPNAECASLCVYDGDREAHRAPMARDGDGVLRGLALGFGAGARYGFRVQGPYDPKRGFRFDAAKLLADPYAWRFDRAFELHPSMFKFGEDTGAHIPKAIAGEPPAGEPGHKRIAAEALVIYELNLRGFSRLNPAIPEAARGTFMGLAHP